MDEEKNTHQPELSTYVSIFNTPMLDKVNVQREDTPQAVDQWWENDPQSQSLETGGFFPDTAMAETSAQECNDTSDSSDYSKWTMVLPQTTWDEQVKPRNKLVRRISHSRSFSSEYYLVMYKDTRDELRDVQRRVKALLSESLMCERKAFLRAENSGVRPALIETNTGIEWYSNRELKTAEIDQSLRIAKRKWRNERLVAKMLRRELINYDLEGQLGKVAQERKAIGKKRWKDGGRGWLGI